MKSIQKSEINNIDSENRFDDLANLYKQIERTVEIFKGIEIPIEKSGINNIVFSGMGGSSIGGALTKDYLYTEIDLPFITIRNYDIPKFVGKNTLIFVSSYSGNTEETIDIYNKARQTGANIISITSGGKLKDISLKDNIPTITIPSGMPPRYAIGYSFAVPLIALSKIGIIGDKSSEIEETINILKSQSKEFSEMDYPEKNPALILANKLINKLPVIYCSEQFFGSVGYRWKCQFCENSKRMAYNNYFTELNHNEIIGWEWKKFQTVEPVIIILTDKEINKRILKTIDITISILKEENIQTELIYSKGESLLARIFSLLYLGDFTSYYLAIINKIDPTPINKIMVLKERLSKI